MFLLSPIIYCTFFLYNLHSSKFYVIFNYLLSSVLWINYLMNWQLKFNKLSYLLSTVNSYPLLSINYLLATLFVICKFVSNKTKKITWDLKVWCLVYENIVLLATLFVICKFVSNKTKKNNMRFKSFMFSIWKYCSFYDK